MKLFYQNKDKRERQKNYNYPYSGFRKVISRNWFDPTISILIKFTEKVLKIEVEFNKIKSCVICVHFLVTFLAV